MNEAEARERLVGIMQSWVGRKESNGSHHVIIDTYNKISPRPRGYKMTYHDPWCATTVSAAAYLAGYTDIIPPECSCARMIENFKRIGCWVEDESVTPRTGDILFYDWNDTGYGDNHGSPEHVGVVESVKNNKIIVIEGNMHKAVGKRSVPVNGRYIRGYGVPRYELKSEPSSLDILAQAGVLSSPSYWETVLKSKKVKYLDNLIDNMADYVRQKK